MRWRAWYAISRTEWVIYSSADTPWQEIPSGEEDGPEGTVGGVVYLTPPYRRIPDGADWYWLEDGDIRSVTTHEEWGKWAPRPDVPASLLKRSGFLDDEPWARVQREMMEAREVPAHV